MARGQALEWYKNYLTSIDFERRDLFAQLGALYPCQNVLYPGSFIHVTPSFYFPRVVYVDKNAVADAFFAETATVAKLIEDNKTYRQPAHFRFICQDYTQRLALPKESFDLLISLYASDIFAHCRRYLKPGGYILANDNHGDASLVAGDGGFELVALVRAKRRRYELIQAGDHAALASMVGGRRPERGRLPPGAYAYLFRNIA